MPEPQWVFPLETALLSDADYAELETIDLSVFNVDTDSAGLERSQLRARDEMVARALKAFSAGGLGMVYVVGHGLDAEDIQRQFDVGSTFFDRVTEQDKAKYAAKISEEGSWAGYKPKGYYGPWDCDENWSFYPETLLRPDMPPYPRFYLHEYREFMEHNHYVVAKKMLHVLSLGLGLPGDALWRLHHRPESNIVSQAPYDHEKPVEWKHSQDHFRFQMYNPRPDDGSFLTQEKLHLRSHRDIGTITLNYSQPIAALQILKPNGTWAWVRHKPGAILVNLGHAMEALTASRLKAAFHRVVEPPEDQREFQRLAIHYFVKLLPDVRIDIPLIQGPDDQFTEYRELGGRPIFYGEWERFRTKLAFQQRPVRPSPQRTAEHALLDMHYRLTPGTKVEARL
ncbi:clavaminate synthase-like protein [Phanerochaete sordida]|uniref:Clavaminate synthase-like protein n=1 Tax=Phanerochaete sordida TaxID=48140 RepID=A0A9P3GEQ9_9APHY|nr:clavaminate synthase-like protein [Phanerochaete sordida]